MISPNDPDKLEFIAIPGEKDLEERLGFIKELLQQWDTSAPHYLVRVKKEMSDPVPPAPPTPNESLYLPNGKLNTPYLFKSAELLIAAGDTHLAKNIYSSILKSGERASLAHLGLGNCFEIEGKLEDARKHFEESITFQGSLDAYKALGRTLIKLSRDLAAADVFERALTLKELPLKTVFELHKAAGNCFTRSKRRTEAESHYKKALEIEPLSDDIKTNLGAVYIQSEAWIQAKRSFEEALASNPKNAQAMAGLATIALHQGDKRLAHDWFAKSLDTSIQNPTAIYHLVKCAYEIRSYAVAARIAEKYIQMAPVNINLLYSLAGLQFHLGRLDEARSTIDRVLKLDPNHLASQELLGLIRKYESTSH